MGLARRTVHPIGCKLAVLLLFKRRVLTVESSVLWSLQSTDHKLDENISSLSLSLLLSVSLAVSRGHSSVNSILLFSLTLSHVCLHSTYLTFAVNVFHIRAHQFCWQGKKKKKPEEREGKGKAEF